MAHPAEGHRLLIKNVQIFDGVSDRLFAGHALIDGQKVAAVETSPIAEGAGTRVIDGAGRVLMPGMSDAHVHLVGNANVFIDFMMATQTQLAASTVARAKDTLLRGFTTVRDMAGDTAGIKKVIDNEPAL
jgi:imidazolonepropionase-like amidohydrolase